MYYYTEHAIWSLPGRFESDPKPLTERYGVETSRNACTLPYDVSVFYENLFKGLNLLFCCSSVALIRYRPHRGGLFVSSSIEAQGNSSGLVALSNRRGTWYRAMPESWKG
jgi:hypothetical protein